MNRHFISVSLELFVQEILGCDRGAIGGFVDADHFDRNPFDAALIAIAARYEKLDEDDVRDFVDRWVEELNAADEVAYKQFVDELKSLVG